MPQGRLGEHPVRWRRLVHPPITAHAAPSGGRVILAAMDTFPCHECGQPVAEDVVVWLTAADGSPDERSGEPFCPGCAAPLPIAA